MCEPQTAERQDWVWRRETPVAKWCRLPLVLSAPLPSNRRKYASTNKKEKTPSRLNGEINLLSSTLFKKLWYQVFHFGDSCIDTEGRQRAQALLASFSETSCFACPRRDARTCAPHRTSSFTRTWPVAAPPAHPGLSRLPQAQ